MPRLPVFVFAVAALALAASADAQVYKWKDASGIVHYSDAPPSTGNYERVKINSNVSEPVAPTPVQAPSAQPAQDSNAAQPATMPDTAANRTKLCKQLDSNIALLNSSSPVVASSSKGPQQNLDDSQRKQALETEQAQKQQYCAH